MLSERLKPSPNARVLERLEAELGHFAIAAVVLQELRFGAERLPPSKRKTVVTRYLDEVLLPVCDVLPYDAVAAEWHAKARARLEAEGRPMPFSDGLIAAIAVTRGLTLVTRNVADFAAWRSLRVESWWD